MELLIDPIPNSPNKHNENHLVDSKENYPSPPYPRHFFSSSLNSSLIMIHTLERGEVLWGKKSCPEMQHTTSIGATSKTSINLVLISPTSSSQYSDYHLLSFVVLLTLLLPSEIFTNLIQQFKHFI